jgi:hypothetical protein
MRNATGARTSPIPSATSAHRAGVHHLGLPTAMITRMSAMAPGMTKYHGNKLKLGSAATAS